MKSYTDWIVEHDNLKKDPQGGLKPDDLGRAKRADLITLPAEVTGTNCGNCRFMKVHEDHGYCDHPDVRMHVNKRMCCKWWDHAKVRRHWE